MTDKTFLHPWVMAECLLLVHLSTGLKCFCQPKQAPADNPDDNWHAYIVDIHADRAAITAQAALDGINVDDYIQYLALFAMELADKAIKERYSQSRKG